MVGNHVFHAATSAAKSMGADVKARAMSQLRRPVGGGDGPYWTPGHAKELTFLNAKLHDKKVDAFAENALLPDEQTPQLRRSAAEKLKKRQADHLARQRKAMRVEAGARGLSAAQVLAHCRRGLKVFVHEACRNFPGIAGAISNKGLVLARLSEADVFVVVTPGRADHPITFASALKGSFQISPGLLVSGHGSAVKMTSVGHLPKVLFISHAFAAAQSGARAKGRARHGPIRQSLEAG